MPPLIRRPTTATQREAIYRLADEGYSLREIAAEVFGDAALKDRVSRVLRTRDPGDAPPPAKRPQDELAQLRLEIARENMAAFERLREMTREPREGEAS